MDPEVFALGMIGCVVEGFFMVEHQKQYSLPRELWAAGQGQMHRISSLLSENELYDYLRNYATDVEPNPYFPPDLRQVLNEFEIGGTSQVWGGENEGAVVLLEEPIDEDEFFPLCRTAAVSRVKHIHKSVPYVNVATQTIGVYPDERKAEIRDALIANGGQGIVSLGGAGRGVIGLPHDAFYPCHRMVRWAVDETY